MQNIPGQSQYRSVTSSCIKTHQHPSKFHIQNTQESTPITIQNIPGQSQYRSATSSCITSATA